MKKWIKISIIGVLTLTVALAGIAVYVLSWPEFGGKSDGARLERMIQSEHYRDGRFFNTPDNLPFDLAANFKDMMGGQVRTPPARFPYEIPEFGTSIEPGLRAWWLGHASVLVEIDGIRVITDPMLPNYAFPVRLVAPKRHDPSPISRDNLPDIDIVTISHDHYDHLDMKTILALAERGAHFFVGLGIGAHLERWGVEKEQIHEMDGWETKDFKGMKIHCTPARHYSGRRSMDDSTLWASWLIEGPKHRIYHSGDSGYAPHFNEIGEKLGPIHIAFIKIGDYGGGKGWKDIHMVPENSIQAHKDLGAKVLFPIHWGTFELSNHGWDEPIKRAVTAAKKKEVNLVTPMLGQTYTFGPPFQSVAWWELLTD